MNENSGVSMIICCYNSSSRITTTLEHLQKIITNTIPWEVILVDNSSDDNTVETAQNTWNKNPVTRLLIVSENKKGLMHARVTGVQSSTYPILSFIDDDNWVEPNWIDKVFSIMQKDPSLAACGGSSEAVSVQTLPIWFPDFSTSFAVGKQQANTGYVKHEKGFLWGAGLTVRKTAWEALLKSGFQSLLKGRTGKALTAGEDSEICLAWTLQGWKLWYDESLHLKHFIPESRLTTSYLEKMYDGFGKAEVILSLYRGKITKSPTNKENWMLQSLAALKKWCESEIKSLFSSGKQKLKNKIQLKHNSAYARELIFNRKKYIGAGNQVDQLAENKISIHQFNNTSHLI